MEPLGVIIFSEEIRKTGILTSTVGMITSTEQMADILETEKADLILLGRELLRNPYFPLLSALQTGDNVTWPKQYTRAK